MFPVFGLSLLIKFGPGVIDNVMGATGEIPTIGTNCLSNTTLDIILGVIAVILALGIFYLRRKCKKSESINKTS